MPEQQAKPRVVETVAVAVEKTGVKKWGIGEWGSVASVIGLGFWLWDNARKNAVAAPVSLGPGRIAFDGKVYTEEQPLPEGGDADVLPIRPRRRVA